jgi:hypothetical protein
LYAGKDKVWCWNGQGVSFRLEGGMSWWHRLSNEFVWVVTMDLSILSVY